VGPVGFGLYKALHKGNCAKHSLCVRPVNTRQVLLEYQHQKSVCRIYGSIHLLADRGVEDRLPVAAGFPNAPVVLQASGQDIELFGVAGALVVRLIFFGQEAVDSFDRFLIGFRAYLKDLVVVDKDRL
jgi:hypothetical protein